MAEEEDSGPDDDEANEPVMPDELCDALYESFKFHLMESLGPNAVDEYEEHMRHYILVDGVVREEPNLFRWSRSLQDRKTRCIDKTVIREGIKRPGINPSIFGGPPDWQQQQATRRGDSFWDRFPDLKNAHVHVSTVFIGTSRDELFESMVFGGTLSETQCRYDTLGEAKRGHWLLVTKARYAANWCSRRKHGRKAKKWNKRLNTFIKMTNRRGHDWGVRHLWTSFLLMLKARHGPLSECFPQVLMPFYFLLEEPLARGAAITAETRLRVEKLRPMIMACIGSAKSDSDSDQ